MEQIFTQITQQQISQVCYDDPLFLSHHFTRYLTYEISAELSYGLAMNNTHLFLYESSNQLQSQQISTYAVKFCFELKFQIIREQWKDQQTPGKPIGIRLQKDNCQPLTFYNNISAVIESWRLKLEQKINQRGFHKLFKAKKKIGKGAFATVYLAERLLDKKLVAVKAFSKERQYSSDKGRDSLINELQIMRKLRNHPNVVNLQGVFQTDNSIYVILENLQGGQLHDKIKTGHKFQLHETIKIMNCILRGLSLMDSKRLIHRDLKPENLLFRSKYSNDLVMADFGLATWAEQPIYLFVRCGTPGFVAPQIINIKDMSTHSDPISDVFSAGLIFHFLLLGKSVFKGAKYAEILAQNRACDFKLSGPEYDSIDRNAYDLLSKMLDVNPKTRVRASQALNHRLFRQSMMDVQHEVNPLLIEQQENSISLAGSNATNNIIMSTNYRYSEKAATIGIGTGVFNNPLSNRNSSPSSLYCNSNKVKILGNNTIYQVGSNVSGNKENLMMLTPRSIHTNKILHAKGKNTHISNTNSNANNESIRKKRETIPVSNKGNNNSSMSSGNNILHVTMGQRTFSGGNGAKEYSNNA